MKGHFLDGVVPDAEDVKPVSLQKGQTRLEARIQAKPLTKVTEQAFKTTVWTRDRKRCRVCGRKVEKVMGRVPERGEVHHLHGRGGELRFEDRCAVLACLKCHERLTGRVSEKWGATGTKFFEVRDKSGVHTYIDARHTIQFRRIV